jgi:DNA-binding response OmpR family regulator
MTETFTILIIDDNVNLARGFAQALAGAGYAVHVAHTAEDGLQLARRALPHAIIVDIRMPFVNGVGFLYRLRALPEHRQTPVLVVTGGPVTEETRVELRDLAAVLRFKPLGLSDLLEETHTLLQPARNAAHARPAVAATPAPLGHVG